jgi:hypothetical protein
VGALVYGSAPVVYYDLDAQQIVQTLLELPARREGLAISFNNQNYFGEGTSEKDDFRKGNNQLTVHM